MQPRRDAGVGCVPGGPVMELFLMPPRISSHGYHMAIMVCRGKTELKCKGEKSDTCYEVDFECLGVAFPAFKTCKGLTTQHITTSTGEVHLVLSSLPCLCCTAALGRSCVA